MKLLRHSRGKSHWWTLCARNGETLCHSEMYASRSSRDRTARKMGRMICESMLYKLWLATNPPARKPKGKK